jgi:hypothetical protein
MRSRSKSLLALASLSLGLLACDGGGLPPGWRETPPGTGPEVVWDLYAEDLPVIPLPNDVATWPDPTSPTGRRINASLVVPTGLERTHPARASTSSMAGAPSRPSRSSFEERPRPRRPACAARGHRPLRTRPTSPARDLRHRPETGLPVPARPQRRQLPLRGRRAHRPVLRPRPAQHRVQPPLRDRRGGRQQQRRARPRRGHRLRRRARPPQHPRRAPHGDPPRDGYDRMAWFYERETRDPDRCARSCRCGSAPPTRSCSPTASSARATAQPVRSPFDHVHHPRQTARARAPAPSTSPRTPSSTAASPPRAGTTSRSRGRSPRSRSPTTSTPSARGSTAAARWPGSPTEFPADVVPLPMQGGSRCPTPAQNALRRLGRRLPRGPAQHRQRARAQRRPDRGR